MSRKHHPLLLRSLTFERYSAKHCYLQQLCEIFERDKQKKAAKKKEIKVIALTIINTLHELVIDLKLKNYYLNEVFVFVDYLINHTTSKTYLCKYVERLKYIIRSQPFRRLIADDYLTLEEFIHLCHESLITHLQSTNDNVWLNEILTDLSFFDETNLLLLLEDKSFSRATIKENENLTNLLQFKVAQRI